MPTTSRVHDDTDGTSTWSLETALSGTDEADDHINIATDGSNVFVDRQDESRLVRRAGDLRAQAHARPVRGRPR